VRRLPIGRPRANVSCTNLKHERQHWFEMPSVYYRTNLPGV
jgi:hypothetical protein